MDGAHSFWLAPCLVHPAPARHGQSLDLVLLDARLRPSFPFTGVLLVEQYPRRTGEGPTPRLLTVTLFRSSAVVAVVRRDELTLEQCESLC